jgi:hypothetical protein
MAAILDVCKVRGRERSERERGKQKRGKGGDVVAWFEQLQGVLVGQDSASRRWPVTSREPPRRSFLCLNEEDKAKCKKPPGHWRFLWNF